MLFQQGKEFVKNRSYKATHVFLLLFHNSLSIAFDLFHDDLLLCRYYQGWSSVSPLSCSKRKVLQFGFHTSLCEGLIGENS